MGLDHSDKQNGCEVAARVSNVSYHLVVVASGVLLDSELSEKSSSIGRVRILPTPVGRTSNHHSSVSGIPGIAGRETDLLLLHVLERAPVLVFFFLFFLRCAIFILRSE